MDVLKKYNLIPHKYIFVREVSTKTINYLGQESNKLHVISNLIPSDHSVVLSLEDKSKIYLYPQNWILLQEPVEDIHSLIYYSRLLISSGDSMAREGAILGITSIYTGDREMAANSFLIKMGILNNCSIDEINSLLKGIFELNTDFSRQENIRSELTKRFDDLTLFMFNLINSELPIQLMKIIHMQLSKIKRDFFPEY